RLFLTQHRRDNHRLRRPSVTKPQWEFTRVHPSDLPLAWFARMVRARLGLHPPAFARFVTWRLRGSGTGLDTGRDVATSHVRSNRSHFTAHQHDWKCAEADARATVR